MPVTAVTYLVQNYSTGLSRLINRRDNSKILFTTKTNHCCYSLITSALWK